MDDEVSALGSGGRWLTTRLALEPAGPANADDLALVHRDDQVWPWYVDERPSRKQILRMAHAMGESWRMHGVGKWIAYDRTSGAVIGRGGLSRTPVDDDWAQIYPLLPPQPWIRTTYDTREPFVAHADWLEVGWALRGDYQGRGYATEMGRAALAYAFDVLGARAVVSCTARHNSASRAVMDRIGMRYSGEIRTRGIVEGMGERDDAPFAVSVLLRPKWDRNPLR